VLRGALRNAPVKLVLAALIGVGASDCVRVPNADPVASGPSIDQVVRRVKCDLVRALQPELDNVKYTWLQTWVAQASLTFIVNDASTLTPGATFSQPLALATVPGHVTNFAQSWNLGLGAGFNTTASRNETVTFSMSLKEIKDEHQSDPGSQTCNYPDLTDIHSELGLEQWIYSALTPVQQDDLTPGHHKTSKTGAGSSSTSGSSSSSGTGGGSTQTASLQSSYTVMQNTKAAYTAEFAKFARIISPAKAKAIIENKQCDSTDPLFKLNCKFQKKLDRISKYEIDDPTTVVTTSVSGITPQQGSTLGGTPVTIIGNNFDNLSDQNGATIGGVQINPTDITRSNDSTICTFTPPAASYPAAAPNNLGVDVVVNASGGAGTKIGAYKYVAPAVTDPLLAISPHFGVASASTLVTITGNDFTGATGVTIGGKAAVINSITSNNAINNNNKPNTITATAPPHDAGAVDVVVTMPDTQQNIIGPSLFTYYVTNKPVNCPPQASAKKRIIAYVDADLDKIVDQALFISRRLVDVIEWCLHNPSCPDRNSQLNALLQTTKALQDSLLALELDPPLDAIGHQVQFIIVFNASISPSWTLLHFKGPTPGSGTGASATGTLTHTLNIAMGPPSSADVANTLGALQLGTAIGNSLGTSGVSVPIPP
jgi:hypothetical protein